MHRRNVHRFDAYLHTISHPFPLISMTGWKTVELEWRRGNTLVRRESLEDESTLYVLTEGWTLSEIGLAKLLQEEAE